MPRNESKRVVYPQHGSSDELVARLAEVMADAAGVSGDRPEIDEVEARLSELRDMPANDRAPEPAPAVAAPPPPVEPEVPVVRAVRSEPAVPPPAPRAQAMRSEPAVLPPPARPQPVRQASGGNRRWPPTPDDVIMEAARESRVQPVYVSEAPPPQPQPTRQQPARQRLAPQQRGARRPPSVGSGLTIGLLVLALVGSWGFFGLSQGWLDAGAIRSGDWANVVGSPTPDVVRSGGGGDGIAVTEASAVVAACTDESPALEVSASAPLRQSPPSAYQAAAVPRDAAAVVPTNLEMRRRTVPVYEVGADGRIDFPTTTAAGVN